MKSLGKIILAFIILYTSACKKKDTTEPATNTTVTINTSLPSISTAPISSINNLTATCGGVVSSEGTSAITAVGICWDTLSGPTTLRDHTNEGAGTGTFRSSIFGLKSGATYFVRAYATNATGTAYGNEVTFKTASTWIPVNANSIGNGANFTSLAFNGSFVFVGTNQGVFRSSDEGISWTSVSNGITDVNIICLAVNGSYVFASTQTSGIYRSSDGGNSWTQINTGLLLNNINSLAVSGSTIFAANINGISVSLNNGTNWNSVSTGLASSGNILSIAFDGTTAYAGSTNGVYMSSDIGNNWVSASNGITSSFQNINKIAISGGNVLAGTYGGIFISSNKGGNWSLVNSSSPSQYVSCFATKNKDVYVGSYGSTYVSHDNGATFSEFGASLPNNSPCVAITVTEKNVFSCGYYMYRLPL